MLRRGFKAEAERKAGYYRSLLNLKEYDPLPARQLADHLKITILTPDEIPGIEPDTLRLLLDVGKGCWSAAIFSKEDKKFIIHNPTHSPFRQESDLMHEIAHAICEHKLKDINTAIFGCLIPIRDYDQVQEEEAEWLGACLQLPQKALFHYYTLRKLELKAISQLFNASEQMVRYRIGVSGVKNIKLKGRG